MISVYTSFICKRCRKESVFLSEYIEVMQGYLVCPYCSYRNVKRENIRDSQVLEPEKDEKYPLLLNMIKVLFL